MSDVIVLIVLPVGKISDFLFFVDLVDANFVVTHFANVESVVERTKQLFVAKSSLDGSGVQNLSFCKSTDGSPQSHSPTVNPNLFTTTKQCELRVSSVKCARQVFPLNTSFLGGF